MDYAVVSTLVTDDITLGDGTHIGSRLGGAGVYALAGLRLWTDSAVLITGVGEDFAALHQGWFAQTGASTAGLRVKDACTAVSEVRYRPDEERTETPRFGPAHYRNLEATPEEIEPFARVAKGVYVFKELLPAYWEQVLSFKKRYGFRLLWEINADSAVPGALAGVKGVARQCDLFSINRTEAMRMMGAQGEAELLAALQALELPMVYLRNGARGAFVLVGGHAYRIPPVAGVKVVDPTGAGNSSSAAALYGLAEGHSPAACGILGSISATACIAQYGPPIYDEGARERAQALRAQMERELENGGSHA